MDVITATQWETIRHFSPQEFTAPEYMSYQLLVRLDSARQYAGIPFRINSSFRAIRNPSDPQSHFLGLAVDISCRYSHQRYVMLEALRKAGFNRIGIYPAHIHVDVHRDYPQEVIWLGDYDYITTTKGAYHETK